MATRGAGRNYNKGYADAQEEDPRAIREIDRMAEWRRQLLGLVDDAVNTVGWKETGRGGNPGLILHQANAALDALAYSIGAFFGNPYANDSADTVRTHGIKDLLAEAKKLVGGEQAEALPGSPVHIDRTVDEVRLKVEGVLAECEAIVQRLRSRNVGHGGDKRWVKVMFQLGVAKAGLEFAEDLLRTTRGKY